MKILPGKISKKKKIFSREIYKENHKFFLCCFREYLSMTNNGFSRIFYPFVNQFDKLNWCVMCICFSYFFVVCGNVWHLCPLNISSSSFPIVFSCYYHYNTHRIWILWSFVFHWDYYWYKWWKKLFDEMEKYCIISIIYNTSIGIMMMIQIVWVCLTTDNEMKQKQKKKNRSNQFD